MPVLRFYDFFAGVGLAELGLAPAWECVWANDNDPVKQTIYSANFEHPDRFILQDVEKIKAGDLPVPVEMAWASFPCQDLSLAGWRRGINGHRSGVFWSFYETMRELHQQGQRPPLIVLENVLGLLYGDSFRGLCEALAALDLQFGALVIDAKHFVPQSRPRVFIVAADARIDASSFLASPETPGGWFPKPVWRARETLPAELLDRWRWWSLPIPSGPVPNVGDLIDDEPESMRWHSPEEIAHLLSLMSPTNLAKLEQARQTPGRSVGFLYRRTRKEGQRAEVRFDGIAGCLRTTYGGSSRQTVLIVQDGAIRSRLLSPREAARLMGVGDGYWLPNRYNDAYRAMGDGVAVPAVRWLADHLLTPLTLSVHGSISGSEGENRSPDSEALFERGSDPRRQLALVGGETS